MLPSDRVLQHQHRARNYQHYADLICDLLQAEKHDELTIKNHHQHHIRASPLPEIHHNEKKASASKDSTPKKNVRSARRHRNRQKNRKLSKSMKKDGASSKRIMCSVRHVKLSSIQLISAVHLSTLWPCIRNP
jgi:hypothetical protein